MDAPHHDTLQPGHRIGQYEIVSFLGAGGMGEVYAARDHKLSREVAVKVLPQRYSGDSSRARRFAAEARTTGSVNHPNIVSVYDAGEADGRAFLVTELLHGETLRTLLERGGRLSVAAATGYAVQIARGLAAAHDRGVVHRDLKPSNIFVTNDGHLKILDFGLAKLVRPEWAGTDRDEDTISMVSNPGTILGSVGYMSPEQVEARPADERSDIFAFGAILYEMLAGQRAFAGPSPVATLSAILKDVPPDLRVVRPDAPHALALIVARCLEKRPDDRLQSARDIVFSLEQVAAAPEPSLASIARAALHLVGMKIARRPTLGATALAIAVAAVFVVLAVNWTPTEATRHDEPRPRPASPPSIERLTSEGNAGSAGISPDGAYVAYQVEDRLWLAHVSTRSAVQITSGTPPVLGDLRFSPDGNLVYFVGWDDAAQRSNLYRVPILGGTPQLAVANVAAFGAFAGFSPDGARVAFERESEEGSALVVASTDGSGESRVLLLPHPATFYWCSWSSDGSRVLCNMADAFTKSSMVMIDATTGQMQQMPDMPGLEGAAWLPDGRTVLGLEAVGHRLQITRVPIGGGEPQRLTNDLSTYGSLSVSRDGTRIAATRLDMTTNLWSLSTEGDLDLRQLTTGVNTMDGNLGVTTTPDDRIVWSSGASGKSADLLISNLDGSERRRLTFDDDADEIWPKVDPTGTYVVYNRRNWGPDGSSEIWRLDLSGGTPVRVSTGGRESNPRVSGDGQWIYFTQRLDAGVNDAFRVPAEGGAPEKVFEEPANAVYPSPDGKWFLVNGNQGPELRSADGRSEARRLRIGLRQWRPDSRAIAYLWGQQGMQNLFLQELGTWEPRQITHFPKNDIVAWGFDYTHDAKRIVFARRSQTRDVVILEDNR